MLELLYVLGIIWWVGYLLFAICLPIIGLIGAAIIKIEDGSFSQGEARGILAMMSAPVTALAWPALTVWGVVLATRNLWSDAEIESPLARRARLREAHRVAVEVAESKAVKERDKKIKELEAQLRPDEPWYPPDWENDRSVDPARRTA